MRTGRDAGFTLPELLIVIAIIGVLAGLIVVSMSSALRLSERTGCVSNLHYLYEGLAMRRSDSLSSQRPAMKVSHWATQWGVLPYIDFDQDVLICPARGPTGGVVEDAEGAEEWNLDELADWGGLGEEAQNILKDDPYESVDISELVAVKGYKNKDNPNSPQYYIEFKEGQYCVKLSPSQYQEARSQGLLGNANSANNFHDHWSEDYSADGSGDVWYCFEDHGGDWDFKDVMVKVHDNGDGTFSLSVNAGFTGHDNFVVSVPEHEHLAEVFSGASDIQLSVGQVDEETEEAVGGFESVANPYGPTDTGTEGGLTFMTNYGLNAQSAIEKENSRYLSDEPGRILLLDYYKPLALVSDGLDWPLPGSGVAPGFARHQGHINVLFTDGSVQTVNPYEIHPASETNRFRYWGP